MEETPSPSDSRRVNLRPTEEGAAALLDLGVSLPTPKTGKSTAYCCLDWTERRWHLGGVLGRAIVQALSEAGSVSRSPTTRAVELHPSFHRWLK